MLTAAAAICLTIALAIDVSRAGSPTLGALWFAGAGAVFLGLAAVFPHWRPRPDRRCDVSDTPQHHAVVHPRELLAAEKRAVARANEWLATHLAIMFGSVWTVWVFFAWPLIAPALSPAVQAKTSYYAQSWIQLFALALFVWVGNRLQKSADAQSDAQHLALTHIATVEDQNRQLLEQNTELTTQVHALVLALSKPQKTLVRKPAKEAGA